MKKILLMIVLVFGFLSSCKKEDKVIPINKNIVGDWIVYNIYMISQDTSLYSTTPTSADTMYFENDPNNSIYIKYIFKSDNSLIRESKGESITSIYQEFGTYNIFGDSLEIDFGMSTGYGRLKLINISNDNIYLQSSGVGFKQEHRLRRK